VFKSIYLHSLRALDDLFLALHTSFQIRKKCSFYELRVSLSHSILLLDLLVIAKLSKSSFMWLSRVSHLQPSSSLVRVFSFYCVLLLLKLHSIFMCMRVCIREWIFLTQYTSIALYLCVFRRDVHCTQSVLILRLSETSDASNVTFLEWLATLSGQPTFLNVVSNLR